MSGKKNKALERELMDDLLEGHTDLLKKAELEHQPDMDLIAPTEQISIDDIPVMSNDTIPQAPTSVSLGSASGEHIGPTPEFAVNGEQHNDPTIRITGNEEQIVIDHKSNRSAASVKADSHDEARASVGRFGAFRNTGSPTGAALAQSETLRIAQSRILELEKEVERVRTENESLAAAGETFRRKADEMSARMEDLENKYEHAVSTHDQEKALLLENKESLRGELGSLKQKTEELELRITSNIQKIRVRERELENRLELAKMENSSLMRSKDEMVLDLKRQIDQLNLELSNYRTKNQELNRNLSDKQDILRRTVKALRLALTMLEGEEDSAPSPVRKAK
jgi:predicted  nucleic acid-binding Zn-ribbon protein